MKKPAKTTSTKSTTKTAPKKSDPKSEKRLTVDAVVKAGLQQCTFGNKSGCGD